MDHDIGKILKEAGIHFIASGQGDSIMRACFDCQWFGIPLVEPLSYSNDIPPKTDLAPIIDW